MIPGRPDGGTFREAGATLVDWIADYLDHSETYPVLSRVKPGSIRASLPSTPPERPEPFATILEDVDRVLMPGITHWNHPSFFAYFGISGSAPGVLGEMLSAALNVNGMLWRTSPSLTELEALVLDWLRQMLGLPEPLFGIAMDTASIASLCAMAAARESLGLQIRERGLAGRADLPRLRVYTSDQTHSSIEKAAIALGIGQAGVRKVDTDDAFRMRPDRLEAAIREDAAAGWRPMCVVGTVGTTATTSIDPVPAIADVCERHGIWLHIDAAYGGSAAILPEMRHVLAGCERADSFLVNPHKWLLVPIDFTAFYTRRPEDLRRAFSLVPEYLRTDDEATNLMDYGLQLGRRFRALKLWMVVRMFGVEGLRDVLRGHIAMAQELARAIDDHPDFERIAPSPLSVVCFRAVPRGVPEEQVDRLNEELVQRLNETGEAYLSHTRLNDRVVLRVAIGNLKTQPRHVTHVWERIQTHARELAASRRTAQPGDAR
jgi:aromatic-L-amino-acid decarboxylase